MDFAQMILNPGVLAALQAQGNPMGKALMEQSFAQRQNEAQQAQAAKHRFDMEQKLKEQALMQMLPDVVKQLNPSNMQDAVAQLLAAGVNPSMLNSILGNIKPDIQDKFNPVTGQPVRFKDGLIMEGGNGMIGAQPSQMQQPKGMMQQQMQVNPFLNTPVGQMEAAKIGLGLQADKAKATEKKLEQISELGNKATATITQLDTLESLLPDFYSGMGADALHTAGAFLGNKKSESAQTFDSEAKKIVLKIAENQTGAQSDKDIALIRGASPSLNKNEATNKNIINIAKAAAYREKQYADLATEWVNNGGDLKEFDKRWRKYSNAFRLVEKKGVGEFALNKNAIENAEMVLDPNFEQMFGDEYEPITRRKEDMQSMPTNFSREEVIAELKRRKQLK